MPSDFENELKDLIHAPQHLDLHIIHELIESLEPAGRDKAVFDLEFCIQIDTQRLCKDQNKVLLVYHMLKEISFVLIQLRYEVLYGLRPYSQRLQPNECGL